MRIEHWIYTIPLRLRSLFQRRRVEQDLDDELQYHLERKSEELVAQGLTQEQARQAALRAMDGLTQRKEECRDARGVNAIDNLFRDIRYGLRVLAKSPGFTAVAVITLALAIGANAVVFGILNGIVLRPLNVPHADTLYGTEYGSDPGWQCYANYLDLRDRNRTFDDLAAFNFFFVSLDTGGDPAGATGFSVTGNYFDVLQLRPFLGRFFHQEDENAAGDATYLVLTHAYWHSRFHDDPGVIGRVVRINKRPYTILGVAPPGFHGTLQFVSPGFFAPIVSRRQGEGEAWLMSRSGHDSVFEIFGHLKRGVTPAQAAADVKIVGEYLARTYPKDFAAKAVTLSHPGFTAFGRAAKAFAIGLTLLAGLILLAACANLGSLFAAHASDRSREVALRLALGSSRRRILGQLLTEAVLISLAGGALGLCGSVVLLQRLNDWTPFRVAPVHAPVAPDSSVYVAALVLALLSGLLFGIVPVRQVFRADPYQIVKAGPAGRIGSHVTIRDVLLAVQIALCAVLVTSSLVAIRGLTRSLSSDFGFDPRNTVLASLNLGTDGYGPTEWLPAEKRILAALESIPGAEHVGFVNIYPPLAYAAGSRANIFKDETHDLIPANAVVAPYQYAVSPGYFRAARTSFLTGRDFTWHDDQNAPRAAMVNRTLAVRLFGSITGALGRHYRLANGTRVQVIGVVEDGKYMSLTEEAQPAMFLAALQSPASQVYFVVHSRRDPQELATAIRARFREIDSGVSVGIDTWGTILDLVLFPARVATISLGVLGMMGAMLSLTGIFGMAAYSVSRRLKELGIRLALGAQRKQVLETALGRSVKLLALGSAAGIVLGVLASRVLAAVVYQASPHDPLVLGGVVLSMALLGLLATWIPAQRALTLDPVKLLREE